VTSKYTPEDLVESTFHFLTSTTIQSMLKSFVDKWMSSIGEFPIIKAANHPSVFSDAVSAGVALLRKLNEDGHVIRLADGSSMEGMHKESNLLLLNRLAVHHFKPKNDDYGDAFERFGSIGILIRMDDKVLRIKSLMANDAKVAGESMADTIVDFTVYGMMALMLVKRKQDLNVVDDSDLPF